MARKSKFSQKNYLATTSLNPNQPSRDLSLADQLIETRLKSEKAKLALLEAEVPDKDVKYMRYEDMPPPSPEQEAEFDAKFRRLLQSLCAEPNGPKPGQTVQDWLIAQGARIPDTPEWKTPLYLEQWSVDLTKQSMSPD